MMTTEGNTAPQGTPRPITDQERLADSGDEALRRRQHHVLKSHKRSFNPVAAGLKRHEVRKTDRNFVEGDRLTLLEVDEDAGLVLTGRRWEGTIAHVTAAGDWGLPPDLCVFTITEGWY